MTHSKEFMAGWLSGFFDGEGSAKFLTHVNGKKHTCYHLSVTNTDPALMHRCIEFLDALGIGHTEWQYRRAPRKDIGTLHICRMADIKRFAELVGFGAPHKAAILATIIAWGTRDVYFPSKFDPVLHEIGQRHSHGESLRSIMRDLGFPAGGHHALAVRLRATGYPVHLVKTGRPPTS